MKIEVENLCFSYSKHQILKKLNFSATEGELIALLGPNGVGKTTFFRCLLGFLKPSDGTISVNGRDINKYSRKDLARQIAYIPQSYSPAFNHTVLDCVLMGVTSQLGIFETPDEKAKQKALGVLESLGMQDLAYKGCMKISGGERQLMLLARALVQDAGFLIMDEPTSNLDFGNTYRVMEKIKKIKEQGYTIMFSTHDPNLAVNYASRIIAMKDGKIIADGKPETIDAEVFNSIYNVNVSVCKQCNSIRIVQ